ncbi:unnamed protein product [Xylocopa violacea]|uniref:phospholipase A1 n=1 Tax=Xylocopa violacea TaxID=135666 RepID=A0ABP1NDC1_XYLVO
MASKNTTMKIIVTLLFFYEMCFCYKVFRNLKFENKGIISDIIPHCIHGVESVSYFLYTRNKPYGEEIHTINEYVPLRANRPVVFLIHGFTSEANNSNYFELITVWLKKEDINIFSLDWSSAACRGGFSLADLLAYNSAVHNVPIVSKHLTNFVIKLVNKYGVNVNEISVIGHSLGAHVAGFSGKHVQQVFKQKYKQIIGLDPAGPEYNDKDCVNRLCQSDAALVQVFHTSRLAMHSAIGDNDFYFNGGNTQPGCILTVCSHSRAVIYFTMTLLHSPCFIGTAWRIGSDSILKWEECNKDTCTFPTFGNISKGTYYVNTTDTTPFCTLQ